MDMGFGYGFCIGINLIYLFVFYIVAQTSEFYLNIVLNDEKHFI